MKLHYMPFREHESKGWMACVMMNLSFNNVTEISFFVVIFSTEIKHIMSNYAKTSSQEPKRAELMHN